MTIKTPYKSEVIEEIKIDTSVIDGKVDIVDTSLDTLLSRLTASRANYLDNINNSNLATLPAISSARIGYLDNINNSELLNITSTILGRIDASISSRSSHTADNVWSVATRALTDKANFSLSTTGIDAIRKSVCLTGDTASSIGKILFDLNARLTSTRAGYLDNLSGGAVALNSTVAKEATLTHATYGLDKIKTETASLVSKVDVIDGIVDLIKVETDKIANATYGLSALNTDLDTLISNLGTVDTVVDAVESKVDAIKLKTDLLFSGIATEAKQNTIIGYIDTEVGAIKAKTDLIGASVATAGEYTSALSTIDAYFDVTTADSTSDATIRDVVGRKTDTANTTVGTTSSLMRYVKGILNVVTSGTYGLSVIEGLVDDLEGRLTATRAGYLDYLANGTYGLAAIKTQTGEIYSFLSGYLNQAIKTSSSPSFVKLTLSQATGTSPLTISSTTVCTNLNADMLDGYHSSSFLNDSGFTYFIHTPASLDGGSEYEADRNQIIVNNPTERTTTSTSFAKLKEIALPTVLKVNYIRASFEMRSAYAATVYGRVYLDGTGTGTNHSSNSAAYIKYTDNVNTSAKTYLQVYGYRASYGGCYIRNQRVEGVLIVLPYTITEGY